MNTEKMEKSELKEITIDELRKIEIKILDDFVKYCESHNLRYYLAAGTLLGAIRHQGFIPWDDDIDIIMPRPDYEKFLVLFSAETNSEYYVMSAKFSDCYPQAFVKLMIKGTYKDEKLIRSKYQRNIGIDIDIFPVDGLPSNEKKQKQIFNTAKKYQQYLYLTTRKYTKSITIFKTVRRIIAITIFRVLDTLKIIRANNFEKKIDGLASEYDFDHAQKVGCIVSGMYGTKEIVNRNIYDTKIKVTFEGKKYNACGGYDEYLTNLYGDYMKLPPKEKQITHHTSKCYIQDEQEFSV